MNFALPENLDVKRIAMILLVSATVIYLDFTFGINKQWQAVKDLGPKISKQKQELDNLTQRLERMRGLGKRHIEIQQKALAKAKRMITEEEIPSLYQDIANIANKDDVKIEQIRPVKEPSKETKGARPGMTQPEQKFTALLINLDLSCDYHRLGQFISDLENDQVFLTVQDLKIYSQEPNPITQKATLLLRTYVKK